MTEDTLGAGSHGTLLKWLLQQRHWQTYRRFRIEYDRVAAELGGDMIGTCPSEPTYRRWLSGKIQGLPRAESCIVLKSMFPDRPVGSLFRPGDETPPPDHNHPVGAEARRGPAHPVAVWPSSTDAGYDEYDAEPAPEEIAHANPVVDSDRLTYVALRPRTVDRATIDTLGTVLANTRRLEDAIGAAPVLAPVRGHLAYLEALANEARGDLRREVVDQASQWAQYIGWLCISGESYGEAGSWFSRSLEWAIEAEDDDLIATVWSFKGHLAWLTGKVIPTIGLSQIARRYRGIYAGQTAYDALQEARGHAALGDAYQAERLIDESYGLVDRALVDLPGAPPWHYYRSPAFWNLERGRALHQLSGYAPKAVELLTAGLDALPPEQSSADWVKAYRRDLDVAQRNCG